MIYEIMYIIPSRYTDTEIDGITASISKILETAGAKVEKTDNLGKLKFAYPIKKERHGTYILTFIETEGETILKIDKDLTLAEEVLRHLIVKREKGIPESSFTLGAYEAPITPEGKRARSEKRVEKPAPKKPAPTDKKMSIDELDKKLESILDSDLGNV
jgi:small subunit ribosomal protein S6